MRVLVSEELKSSAKPFATFVVLGTAALLVMRAAGWPSVDSLQTLSLIVALPVLIVAFRFATLALHEIGHAVAARAYSLRVDKIRVSGLLLVFHGEAQAPKSDLGGGVYVEDSLHRDRPWPSTVISLAGPAVDIAVALSAGLAALVDRGPLSLLWILPALSSASSAYVSLVPSASGGYDSDIKQILDVWSPRSQVFALRSLHRIWPILDGEDPALFSEEDVRRAEWLEDTTWRVNVAQIATYHAIAVRSPDAPSVAERFAELSEEVYENAETEEDRAAARTLIEDALLEEAFCRALFDRDLRGSEALVDRLDWLSESGYHTARRAYAAQALAAEDYDACRERVEQARKALDRVQASSPGPLWPTAYRFLNLVEEADEAPAASRPP